MAIGDLADLRWRVCIEGFVGIWPAHANGLRGDIWSHSLLHIPAQQYADLVPFHKLTQWLVYSLADALHITLGWTITGMDAMTGLPEYRNGGLLVDCGVLKLKDSSWLTKERWSIDS